MVCGGLSGRELGVVCCYRALSCWGRFHQSLLGLQAELAPAVAPGLTRVGAQSQVMGLVEMTPSDSGAVFWRLAPINVTCAQHCSDLGYACDPAAVDLLTDRNYAIAAFSAGNGEVAAACRNSTRVYFGYGTSVALF